jgi:hypothetical protein
LFLVLSIITVVEAALPGAVQLAGKPALVAMPWFSMSVGLNVLVTSMICARILRIRAQIRDVISPEMSRMYTGVATMLIESALPFSILGIGLVITVALGVGPRFAFAYVWSIFCVESSSSCDEGELLNALRSLSVSIPSNDHPPGLHGPWVA